MLRTANQTVEIGRDREETNPGYEYKQSGRDQDQTDVPARPSSPFVDKDLDAIGEEDEVYPLKKVWATRIRGVGGDEDIP